MKIPTSLNGAARITARILAVTRDEFIDFNGLRHNHLSATEKTQALETKNKILEHTRTTNEEPHTCIAAVKPRI